MAPAKLRAFADGLCDARGIPQLALTVNASCRSASFDGAKMLVEIPAGFGSGAVERRAVAHEVAHAYRWVWGLDWPRKRRDRMISWAAYAAAGVLVLAGVVGVVVDTFFGVDALAGVALLAMVVVVAALGVAPVWSNAATRSDEAATDALAAEWGYPVLHADIARLEHLERGWARLLPVWARSHPQLVDRHRATAPGCPRCLMPE